MVASIYAKFAVENDRGTIITTITNAILCIKYFPSCF